MNPYATGTTQVVLTPNANKTDDEQYKVFKARLKAEKKAKKERKKARKELHDAVDVKVESKNNNDDTGPFGEPDAKRPRRNSDKSEVSVPDDMPDFGSD